MKKLLCIGLVSLAFSSLATIPAHADTISFYNTGVADDGSVLAAGAADSHYTLISSADPDGTTALASTAHPFWQQNTGTASWISPGSSGTQDWDPGDYVYETLLDLTGYDPTTASLAGMIAADNEIYLNGSASPLYSGVGFGSLSSFLINTGFVSGINKIDFVVHNDDGPSGLIVDDAVATANSETPEPASLLLLASGAALAIYALRNGPLRSCQG